MSIVVDAIYEDGVLKLERPLPLQEHEKVRIRIDTAMTWAERTAGMMGWKGRAEEADYFALSPELDFPLAEEEA
jgi:predicted DNA-binding antitoxin AbrB/MazE fold protein